MENNSATSVKPGDPSSPLPPAPPTLDLSEYSPGDTVSSMHSKAPDCKPVTLNENESTSQPTMNAYKLVSGDLSSHLLYLKVDKGFQTSPFATEPSKVQADTWIIRLALFMCGFLTGIIFNILSSFWMLFIDTSQRRAIFSIGLILGIVVQGLLIIQYHDVGF